MKKLIAKITLVLLASILLWFLYFALGQGTNVYFESSDGKWRNGEDLFKSYGFDAILFTFEKYRLKCNPDAELFRVTDREDATFIDNLLNRYSQPKWMVPYRGPALASVQYPDCYEGALTEEQTQEIREGVNMYIEGRGSHNKSPQSDGFAAAGLKRNVAH